MSSTSASLYPISQLLSKMVMNSGYTVLGFMSALGQPAAEADLELWLREGEGPEATIGDIANAYPEEAENLQKAVLETRGMKAAGVDPASLIPTEEDLFVPFLFAEGERTVPTQITFFGITGGFDRWNVIRVPKTILSLPADEQLPALSDLMTAYRREHNGKCPFFGKLTGFKFVRFADYYEFDADGQFLEHVHRPFRHGACWVELR